MRSSLLSVAAVFVIMLSTGGMAVRGACPSADIGGDCRVNLEDFSILAQQWLTVRDTDDLARMFHMVSTPYVTLGSLTELGLPSSRVIAGMFR